MKDIASQYRIIAAGAGWAEKPSRGRLRFEGRDTLEFLHALLTNDVAALPAGGGAYAAYLTPQGRMIADLHVFVRPDSVIADVPAAEAAALAAAFDLLIFAEDVRVTDQTASMRQLSVVGAGAAEVLVRAFGLPADTVRERTIWSQLDIPGGFIARTDDAAEGSWDVVVAASEAGTVVSALEDAGAERISGELLEALRIDSGRPLFGVDMTPETIPLEAGLLDRAISQTKGCYVGQEVIIRVLHRGGGRVAKRLVRLLCDEQSGMPVAGAAISRDGRDIGRVTSAAFSPRAGRVVGLGYVPREIAEAGGDVMLSWAGASPATPVRASITGLAG